MKKILHTFTFCFLFTLVQAQPSLLSTEMLAYGSVMTNKGIANLTVIDTTIQGSGAVWNFSALTSNANPDFVVNIVNPSSTPYAASFPSANYGYKEVKGTTTNYRYFNLTSAKMERVGSYVSNVNSYSNPQTEYVFPFVLGTINNDTWSNTNSSSGGTYDLKCVGTGTLTTPGGTFNALMVRVHVVESFLDLIVYYWYSTDNGAVLLSYVPGDGFFVAAQGTYMSSLAIGIEENEFITDTRYNNPVEDNFRISFQSKNSAVYSYTVINTLGQKIYTGNADINAGNTETLDIDFSAFPGGIYFFTIRSNESEQATKTIKIVKR